MTTRERLYLFDTTLRDGAQTTGIDFSVADKRRIAAMLADLGLDYVEGGYPGANPTDTEFFASNPFAGHAILDRPAPRFTAFGMTKRAGRSAANDPGFQAILQSKADAICLVAKAWDYHVRVALGITNEENIEGVSQSVTAVRETQREAMIDCEHFFDGYKGNRAYALAVAKAAYAAGARWVVLCDTNGGTLPHEIADIVAEVATHVPGTHLGIHTHNDTENAVANTLAAVRAGARQVQGTINGLGERCGNANMIALIPNLVLKMGFDTGLKEGALPANNRRTMRDTSSQVLPLPAQASTTTLWLGSRAALTIGSMDGGGFMIKSSCASNCADISLPFRTWRKLLLRRVPGGRRCYRVLQIGFASVSRLAAPVLECLLLAALAILDLDRNLSTQRR